MTDQHDDRPAPLRSTLAYLEREAARRAKGSHPGMMRLDDAELGALLELLRREVGAVPAERLPIFCDGGWDGHALTVTGRAVAMGWAAVLD